MYYRKVIKINMKYEKNKLKLLSFMGVKFQTPKTIKIETYVKYWDEKIRMLCINLLIKVKIRI